MAVIGRVEPVPRGNAGPELAVTASAQASSAAKPRCMRSAGRGGADRVPCPACGREAPPVMGGALGAVRWVARRGRVGIGGGVE